MVEELSIKLGGYDSGYKLAEEEINKEYTRDVRGYNATFKVVAGPMYWNNVRFKKTYMLEIHYKDSDDAHNKQFILCGAAERLYRDYAEQANQLAEEFCDKHDFTLKKHINSWPEFQAVIEKK